MASLDIQRNDTVQVISGSDRDKKGRVLRVFPDTGRLLVEHVRVVKKHLKRIRSGGLRAGLPSRSGRFPVERDAGLPELQSADAGGAQVRRRCEGTNLQEVRRNHCR